MAVRFRSDAENRKSGRRAASCWSSVTLPYNWESASPAIKQWIYKKKIR